MTGVSGQESAADPERFPLEQRTFFWNKRCIIWALLLECFLFGSVRWTNIDRIRFSVLLVTGEGKKICYKFARRDRRFRHLFIADCCTKTDDNRPSTHQNVAHEKWRYTCEERSRFTMHYLVHAVL